MFVAGLTAVGLLLDAPGALSGPLPDPELLDQTEAKAARYFWEEAFVNNGFVWDGDYTPLNLRSSIAATGFGLAALVVMAERYGTSPEWTITPEQAQARAELILSTAVAIQAQQAGAPALYGKAGFLYHLVNSQGQRWADSEVSTIDTALFTAGALTAGRYFGGSVEAMAETFFDQLDWLYFFHSTSKQFRHAWKPLPPPCINFNFIGYGITPPDGDGCLSNLKWNRPTDEVLLINLLALASDPKDDPFRLSLYAWPRETRTYDKYSVVNSYFGSLFTYLFGHIFFDFDRMGEDNPPNEPGAPQPVDWFENATQAALANRQFVIDEAVNFPTYSAEQWGLSACYRPNGAYLGNNGAKPAEINNGTPWHYGVVPPYGSISSLPLLRTSPDEALSDNLAFQALRHYYDTYSATPLWGPYGPRDSLETVLQNGQPVTTYAPMYLGIDVGSEALMIENYRSNLIPRHFMTYLGVRQAVRIQFPDMDVPNTPPVLSPIGNRSVAEGHLLTIILAAQDADGDGLTYGGNPLPSGATMTRNVFRWTPTYTQAGIYLVTFTASDGELEDSETITITVGNTAAPRFISAPQPSPAAQ